jgi:endonuclease/exonuclease/phosphatase family metal-dependent hydrolase
MTTIYPGLLTILLLALGTAPAIAGPEEPDRPLRVVTYNLLHGGPLSGLKEDTTHLETRLEMAIRNLEALDPDLIALQEVSKTRRHGHVAERLAHRLGYKVVYAAATDRVFGVPPLDTLIIKLLGFQEGVAILSRFPIVASAISTTSLAVNAGWARASCSRPRSRPRGDRFNYS